MVEGAKVPNSRMRQPGHTNTSDAHGRSSSPANAPMDTINPATVVAGLQCLGTRRQVPGLLRERV